MQDQREMTRKEKSEKQRRRGEGYTLQVPVRHSNHEEEWTEEKKLMAGCLGITLYR